MSDRQSWEQQVSADLGAIKQKLSDLPCTEHRDKLNELWNSAHYNKGLRAGFILLLTGMGGTVGSLVSKYGALLLKLVDGR